MTDRNKYMKNRYLGFLALLFSCTLFAQTSIHDLARNGDLDEVKKHLSTSPEAVNQISEQGFSPLLLAVYYNHNKVAQYLIEQGAEVDEDSAMGSPLMASVVKDNIELATLLLAEGANVNAVDANGTSSLIYAVTFQLEEMVALLLKYEPNRLHKDEKGFTAIDYAEKLNNKKIEALLKNE
jgi:ankyrin repeat protein